MKKFNKVGPLVINSCEYAEVASAAQVVFIGECDSRECFNVEEATLLRDWLNTAIPPQASDAGDASGN